MPFEEQLAHLVCCARIERELGRRRQRFSCVRELPRLRAVEEPARAQANRGNDEQHGRGDFQFGQEHGVYQPFWGLAPTRDSKFLWLSNSATNRVFRVRDPLTNPVVDVILGQTDINGRFELHGIAPGAYHLFAWAELPGSAYLNAEFMKKYEESGKPVRIEKTEPIVVDVDAQPNVVMDGVG